MKKMIIIFMVLFSCKIWASIDTLKSDSKITGVTVFFNGAQVVREINLKASKGKHIIKVDELSSDINPQSVQVNGLEDCVILSVKHQKSYAVTNKDTKAEFDNKLREYEVKIREIKNKINVFEIEEEILLANSQINRKDKSISISEIKEAAEFYRLKLNEIHQEILNLNEKLKDIQKEVQNLYVKQNELLAKENKDYSQILISVDCKRDINDKIKLSYYVPSAGWTPLYDFRVDDVTEPLSIVYNANVYQSSGENWNNVNMVLSTNNPLLSGEKPELITWYVDRKSPYQKESIKNGFGTLTGRVFDAEMLEPIPFANITISRGDEVITGTVSDFNGQYTIKPIESGYYDLEVSFLGYASVYYKGVLINSDVITFQDFKLTATNDILEEIAIYEYKVPLISKENPSMESFEISTMPARSYSSAKDVRGSRAYQSDEILLNMENIETTNYISNSIKNTITNLEYSIDIPYTIPSDGKDYSIKIKEVLVPVNYVYYAVPKLDDDVFLTAEINDWSQLNLMPGKSSIYYQRTYTGESYINSNNMNDTLIVSLGRDKGISIKRENNKEIFDKKIIGNNIKETIGWDISVRNNKPIGIKLVIEDQFPISSRKSIEVERLEYSEANLNDKTGKLTWILNLEPNEKKELNFKYSVKYPKLLNLSVE